jgi:hypothetical protein
MCALLKGTSHSEVLNAVSHEANGIKMLQRTRDNSQVQFVTVYQAALSTLSRTVRSTTERWAMRKMADSGQ